MSHVSGAIHVSRFTNVTYTVFANTKFIGSEGSSENYKK